MKILHAVPAYAPEGPGGIELYSRDLVRCQQEAGHDPVVLAGAVETRDRCEWEEERVDGARVLRFRRDDLYYEHHGKSYHPGAVRVLAELLAQERPDVLHVHHWLRLTSNLVEIAHAARVPTVVTLHDAYASCPRCYRVDRWGATCWRPLSVASCRACVPRFVEETDAEVELAIELFHGQYLAELDRASAVLVSNDWTGAKLAELTGFPPERFEPLALGYRRRFEGRARASAQEDVLRIGCWGRVARHKGVDTLLRAFRTLCQEAATPNVELHVFGPIDPGGLEEELRSLAQGLPVRFHGNFDPLDLARAGLRLGVFPSDAFETHGLVLDECFELGLPALVPTGGLLHDRAGDAAFDFAPGSASSLARVLGEVTRAPDLLRSRTAAIGPLPPTMKEHVASLQAVYERVLRSGPRPETFAHPSPEHRARLQRLQEEGGAVRGLAGPPA